jgi:N-acetylglucosaminyldiphosphoundecaprenol N-acetyl-beta-D-mannosaminyltransferase
MAGVTQRAPESWQRLGFEWAYRLKQEPGRLWRRYLRTNTRFILQVIIERFRPTPALARRALPNLQPSKEIANG